MRPALRNMRRLLGNVLSLGLILTAAVLLGLLSHRYPYSADWTHAGRRSLSPASIELLGRLDAPLTITAYARDHGKLRKRIKRLIERYRRYRPDIRLDFVDPDAAPNQVRELGITLDGELLLHYQGRSEHLREYTEQAFTRLLGVLVRGQDKWVAFIEGHGERSAFGEANADLGQWVKQIGSRGLRAQSLNLAKVHTIPGNTSVLVIASPRVDLLPAETRLIRDYIEAGGNLLWLGEPGSLHGLAPLTQAFGLEFLPGTIIDPGTIKLGIDQATMALVTHYPDTAPLKGFKYLSIFPQAAGIGLRPPAGWQWAPLLQTSSRAWSETGPLSGRVGYDADNDLIGPLNIGVRLTRQRAGGGQQRIVITGDGDFLSNAYLGNSGNLDLGLRLLNWLAGDDQLIDIPARTAPDTDLRLGRVAKLAIGSGFLLLSPLALWAIGLLIWLRRRRL